MPASRGGAAAGPRRGSAAKASRTQSPPTASPHRGHRRRQYGAIWQRQDRGAAAGAGGDQDDGTRRHGERDRRAQYVVFKTPAPSLHVRSRNTSSKGPPVASTCRRTTPSSMITSTASVSAPRRRCTAARSVAAWDPARGSPPPPQDKRIRGEWHHGDNGVGGDGEGMPVTHSTRGARWSTSASMVHAPRDGSQKGERHVVLRPRRVQTLDDARGCARRRAQREARGREGRVQREHGALHEQVGVDARRRARDAGRRWEEAPSSRRRFAAAAPTIPKPKYRLKTKPAALRVPAATTWRRMKRTSRGVSLLTRRRGRRRPPRPAPRTTCRPWTRPPPQGHTHAGRHHVDARAAAEGRPAGTVDPPTAISPRCTKPSRCSPPRPCCPGRLDDDPAAAVATACRKRRERVADGSPVDRWDRPERTRRPSCAPARPHGASRSRLRRGPRVMMKSVTSRGTDHSEVAPRRTRGACSRRPSPRAPRSSRATLCLTA